jgi:hypothetical protein
MPRFAELGMSLCFAAHLAAGAAVLAIQMSSDARAEEAAWEPLARFTVEKSPPAPIFVALTRLTYDTQAVQPSQSRPGPVVEYVETGRIELEAAGGVTVLRGPPDAAKRQETIDQGTPVMLGPGDSVFIAGGTAASPRNPGEEPANVLVAEIGSAEDNRQAPAAPVPVKGIAAQSLASAVATTVPAAPVVIELGRLTLAPGAKISSESRPGVVGPQAGPELTAVESGTFGLKVSTGEVELFPQGRSTLGTERKGRGQMAPLLTETALRPRDAMLGQSGASDMMWNAGKVPAAAILIRFLPVKKQP